MKEAKMLTGLTPDFLALQIPENYDRSVTIYDL